MKKLIFLFFMIGQCLIIDGQIEYNWQNSKEGWVSGGDCNLTTQPNAMAMRLYSSNGLMRSGTLSDDLGITNSDYDQVQVTVKNPTTGSGIARLFIYEPGNNTHVCYYSFQVDTAMTTFSTYTISLDSTPSSSSSVYTGPIARFGLRAPWGGANLDTIFWKQMIISNATTSIDENETKVFFDIYPNPTKSNFVVSASNIIVSINVTDLNGKVVYFNDNINNKTFNILNENLDDGMYFVNVKTSTDYLTKSLIIQ
jgi:hypothetical protein